MEVAVGRQYQLVSSDNFEEYLQFIGVGYLSRKAACSVSPVLTVTKNDDGSWTVVLETMIRNITATFTLGEEFEEERPDGVMVRSKYYIEDGKLHNIQIESNGRTSRHVREITEDKVILTTTCDGWDGKSVRIYEAIQ